MLERRSSQENLIPQGKQEASKIGYGENIRRAKEELKVSKLEMDDVNVERKKMSDLGLPSNYTLEDDLTQARVDVVLKGVNVGLSYFGVGRETRAKVDKEVRDSGREEGKEVNVFPGSS